MEGGSSSASSKVRVPAIGSSGLCVSGSVRSAEGVECTIDRMLLDTGADFSLISANVMRELHAEQQLVGLERYGIDDVVGADGTSLPVLGIIKVDLDLGLAQRFPLSVIVVEKCCAPCLLGLD